MTMNERDSGFTLIEVLVVIGLLAIVSVAFYQVLISGTRGANTVRAITNVSEEARLGLNRMIRDTRQAKQIIDTDQLPAPTATSYSIDVDLDGSGVIENPNPQGDYETETFRFDADARVITLTGGRTAPFVGPFVLVRQVSAIPGKPLFSYTSNHLEYDWSTPPSCVEICGVTTLAELQDAPNHGVAAFNPLIYLSNVNYAVRIGTARVTDFFGQAQLRNLR